MRVAVIVILLTPIILFAAILAAIFVPEVFRYPSGCGRLCRPDFWESATVSDVAAEMESGKDVNGSRGTDLNSPLHLAIQHNSDVAVVEYILRHGADPNSSGYVDAGGHHGDDWWKSHRTPLQLAADTGSSPAVVQQLLRYGADPNPPTHHDRLDESPLFYASRLWYEGSDAVVAILLEAGADVNSRSINGLTPLHRAMYKAAPTAVALMLSHGADVHARTNSDNFNLGGRSETPLHAAAESNPDAEVITTLLAWNADINAEAIDGVTPLHRAVSFNESIEVVALMLDRGADINAKTTVGETPLHWAVAHRLNSGVIPLLMDRGADVKAQNVYGDSPLHITGDLEIVALLIERGADKSSRNKAGKTPCENAKEHGGSPVLQQTLCR